MTLFVNPSTMSFDEAARAVLDHLREHVPMGFWAVTRVENDRQTYLYLDDNAYGAPQGGSHPWSDSYCIHMAAGTAPAIAPDAALVPAYAAAGVNAVVDIGAYAGAVICEPDGAVFGAVCGLDPRARTDDPRLTAAGPLLDLVGQLLSAVLAADRAREHAAQVVAEARSTSETDALTGLANRRAWDRQVAEEAQRFHRFADPTVVVMADLDRLKVVNDTLGHAAGDEYLRTAARALRGAVRESDLVARLGGDEFGAVFRGCTEAAAEDRVSQIGRAFDEAGVEGSVGWAPVSVVAGFGPAVVAADHAMYEIKRDRRAAAVPLPRAATAVLPVG